MKETSIQKLTRIKLASNHQEPDRVPIYAQAGSAVVGYSGMTWWDVEKDFKAYQKMLDKFYGAFPCDMQMQYIGGNPRSYDYLHNRTEYFLADDNVTVQHAQSQDKMRADEYDKLIADPIGFIKKELLPRKYPELFHGSLEDAAKRTENALDELIWNLILGPNGQVNRYLTEAHGIVPISSTHYGNPAIDVIFDRFRGFSGTLTDMRRQPKAVKAACEVIRNTALCDPCKNIVTDSPFAAYIMAHIPTYTNPKQFETYYWPEFKQLILNLHENGQKLYLLAEGTWKHLWDYFLELPDNSVFIQVDDDDIFDVNKKLGAHQIIGGGLKINMTKMYDTQVCIDYAKRVIDECAPGGGFIFCNDKSFCCAGDINQTAIDVFNFAAEYGKY